MSSVTPPHGPNPGTPPEEGTRGAESLSPPSSHGPLSAAPFAVDTAPHPARVGLVLSGGGVRGAYEAGVVQGIVEVLGLGAADPAPFGIFAGTSVGAINAAFFAGNAHRGDLAAHRLAQIYRGLSLSAHVKPRPMALLPGAEALRRLRARVTGVPSAHAGQSFLDPAPLERLVQESVSWQQLHDNVASGKVRALVVAALNIATGRTAIFAHTAPFAQYRPSRDPRRVAFSEPITSEHVLASAAIPLVFPARRVGRSYYSDGGLRFNTPISPAIRCGANRLVVVSLLSDTERPRDDQVVPDRYPSPAFLAGKLLNALLLDPVIYDLQVLERVNGMMRAIQQAISQSGLEQVQRTLIATRGAPYRRIDTLVFRPTRDIGLVAGRHLRRILGHGDFTRLFARWLDGRTVQSSFVEADLASYLLFDGGFAGELVDQGREDALDRADDVRRFFDASDR